MLARQGPERPHADVRDLPNRRWLETRVGYGEDLLRSQFAQAFGNARQVADDWKGRALAKASRKSVRARPFSVGCGRWDWQVRLVPSERSTKRHIACSENSHESTRPRCHRAPWRRGGHTLGTAFVRTTCVKLSGMDEFRLSETDNSCFHSTFSEGTRSKPVRKASDNQAAAISRPFSTLNVRRDHTM